MFTDPPLLLVPRLTSSVAWSEIAGVPLVEVTTGGSPEQGTLVRTAWDGAEIRFRFEMVDSDPWATLTERDAPLYKEEVAEVFLDPFGDLLSYFEFEVNPRNAVLDLVLRRSRAGLVKDTRWRCEGLRSSATLTETGWILELALPIASLTPEPPVTGTRWRAQFCRIDRPRGRERELSAWSPTGRPLFHVPERFGWLEFA